jgi:radical SAM superfamily enzyme YgiQ (UPF0313 family)
MKILLVVPAAEHLRVNRHNDRVPRRKMLRFSVLPLSVVAALTPPGHQVEIRDENVEPIDMDADVDVVGVTFMTALAPRAYQIAREFRARGVVTVAGGYHPTFCPAEAARHFDAVVVGEAEATWPQVLRDIESGCLRRTYRATAPADLSVTPMPRRDLLAGKARHYVTTNAVQTGRGCNHSCRYCSITAFHKGVHRTRPIERVLEELRQIPRDFMFVDDNIMADPEYARRLFTAMAPLRKRWVSQCSIRIADDPELLRLARRAGCYGLFIGIETLSPENLAGVHKEFNDSQGYLRRIAAIRRCGIGVQAGIIVGMDNDDVTVFQRMLRFLQEARIDAIQLNILTPLPGTPLFEDFERAGRVIDRDWGHYDFRHTVIQPARMTPAQLQDGADWLYRQYYRLDRIILRAVRSVFTIGWLPALLSLRLNLTYRYDNIREGVRGRDPGRLTWLARVRRAGLALRDLLQHAAANRRFARM